MQSKLPRTGTSIFAVMTTIADETGAINLSQGFPSFDPPAALLERVTHHLTHGQNQYAPMPGMPALRREIANKVSRLYGRTIDEASEVTVCDGATEGLFSVIHTVIHPGDEVIVFDPAYDSYEPAVALAGGKTIHIPLITTAAKPDFHVDWDQVRDSITNRTKLIVVNFPHNPTGVTLATEDLAVLADILSDTSIKVLSDEVYEHIVFDGKQHESLVKNDLLWERTFVVSSFGKTYHATGWKVGYCVAPKALMEEFRKIHQWVCYAVVTPIQCAIADYMASAPAHYAELPVFYEQKRDRFCDLVRDSRFSFRPAQGTFFQILDYSAITDENDLSYAKTLAREIGVASIPVSVFCAQPDNARLLRFCFAKDDDMLVKAAERLCKL